jgi:hypothetical protein
MDSLHVECDKPYVEPKLTTKDRNAISDYTEDLVQKTREFINQFLDSIPAKYRWLVGCAAMEDERVWDNDVDFEEGA